MDYSFMDIHSSAEADDGLLFTNPTDLQDPVSRLNVWQLEGETGHHDLLEFAINQQTLENCMVVITLDFAQVNRVSL